MSPTNIIYHQIGGNKFRVMTGAKCFSATDNDRTLCFCLPGKPGFVREGINVVSITLNDMDLYDMKFERVRRRLGNVTHETVAEKMNVYNDQLQPIFTTVTGLNTHL